MKIQFLGTGGADWPNLPEEQMEYFRYHASIIVNNSILVDPGPGICVSAEKFQIDLSRIEAVFVTHTHPDHWDLETINEILEYTDRKICLYFHEKARDNLRLDSIRCDNLISYPMKRGEKVIVSGTVWQNLEANHYCEGEETGSHYLISKGGEKWLYGCDGGWFTTRTWDIIRENKLDGVILDGTIGENTYDYRLAGHNTLQMNQILAKAMIQQEILKPEAKLYLSHFGRTTYECGPANIKEKVEQAGYRMAEDGMIIESLPKAQKNPLSAGTTGQSWVTNYRTIGGIGDSLASGEIVSLNPDGTRCYTDYYERSWGQYMAEECHIKFTNYSVGGLNTKMWYEKYAESEAFLQYPQELYMIGLGANDANAIEWGNMVLGIPDDFESEAESFAGWYGKILHLIRRVNPSADIIVITDPMPSPIGLILNDYIRWIPDYYPQVKIMDLERYASGLYNEKQLTENNLWYLGHMTAEGYLYAAKIMMAWDGFGNMK